MTPQLMLNSKIYIFLSLAQSLAPAGHLFGLWCPCRTTARRGPPGTPSLRKKKHGGGDDDFPQEKWWVNDGLMMG